MTTTFIGQPMAWTHQRIKYTSNDCINFKALWKMLILDNSHEHEDIKNKDVSTKTDFLLSLRSANYWQKKIYFFKKKPFLFKSSKCDMSVSLFLIFCYCLSVSVFHWFKFRNHWWTCICVINHTHIFLFI